MVGRLRIEIEIVGVVNGVPVAVTGKGHIGSVGESGAQGSDPAVPGRHRLDLELLADVVPLSFDPAFLALGGLDALLLVSARPGETVFPADPLHVHLDWNLLDENYRDMGGIVVASSIRADAGRLVVRGQFLHARTRLEPVERVTSVQRVLSTPPIVLGPDGVVVTSTAEFDGSFGNGYNGIAVTRAYGVLGLADGAGDPHSWAVAIERAGGCERDHRVLLRIE